ncbi:MAG: hypothetical protein ACRERD_14880 [Candidatus Binatia bacterium]
MPPNQADAQPEPAILVGHSVGGVVITQTAVPFIDGPLFPFVLVRCRYAA